MRAAAKTVEMLMVILHASDRTSLRAAAKTERAFYIFGPEESDRTSLRAAAKTMKAEACWWTQGPIGHRCAQRQKLDGYCNLQTVCPIGHRCAQRLKPKMATYHDQNQSPIGHRCAQRLKHFVFRVTTLNMSPIGHRCAQRLKQA